MDDHKENSKNGSLSNPAVTSVDLAVTSGDPAVDGDDEDVGHEGRAKWGNQAEFILTCVGYAVGLGNVWRFPYLCYKNGGGAFLVPYIIMLGLCGLPLFFFELCFGQFASLGPLAIWTINPMFKGIGIAMVVVSCFVGLYYNILVAYILYFFFASMQPQVPWSDCDNHWNSEYCLTADQMSNKSWLGEYLNSTNMTNEDIKTPSEEYYYREVLKLSPGVETLGGVVWQLLLCLLLAWTVVFLVLLKGISSLGKVVYFTSTFPYIMMTIMVIRGCLLDGATDGLIFYLKPDFNKLNNAEVWSDAAVQIFYSLSTCSGGLIAMASYNKFDNNVYRDSIMVPIINCVTSIFSGLAIFSVLGYMAKLKGVPIDEVAESGPGLVFVVYPEGLSNMPVSTLWSLLFFLMMLILGFSSQFSIVECVFTALMDEFPKALRSTPTRPIILRAVGCLLFFLLSIPMVCEGGFYLFSLCDAYAGGFPRLFTGILELMAVCWVYGISRFSNDVKMMIGFKPNWYFKICWCVLTPVLVIAIVVFKAVQHKPFSLFSETYLYPAWADGMGWMMVVFVVMWIPIWWIIQWCMDGGLQVLRNAASPTDKWGPAQKVHRTGKYAANAAMTSPRLSKPQIPAYSMDTVVLHAEKASYVANPDTQNVYDNDAYSAEERL